jgi:integrase
MDLKEVIRKARPTLSESSITTYNSILKNLYRKIFGDKEINLDDFENSSTILKHLENTEPNKRKTILSALVVICKDPKPYRSLMLTDIKDYNNEISTQEKTDDQKEYWIEPNQLHSVFEKLKKEADYLYKKSDLTMIELQKIQNYIIIALFHLIPPRRAKDYCDFKIKAIDKETDNWFDEKNNELSFASYKTAKFYGIQKIQIDKVMKAILKKWIAINPSEYLLFDSNHKKLSPVKLNQRLNKIFGSEKGMSVNSLRHSFLSNKYQDSIKMNEDIAKDMTDMGSSIAQSKTYIQKSE